MGELNYLVVIGPKQTDCSNSLKENGKSVSTLYWQFLISVTGMKCQIVSSKLPLSKYWRTASALRDFTMRVAPMPWRSVLLRTLNSCQTIFPDIRGLHRSTTGLLQRDSKQNGTIQSGKCDRYLGSYLTKHLFKFRILIMCEL